jgi:hypothetical protein
MPDIQQRVIDHGSDRRYFHQMLNLADDELDPYEYRLLGHFRRVAGDRSCVESVRQTARHTRMSVGMVVRTTQQLVDAGWIRVTTEGAPGQQWKRIEIVDRWRENVERYAPPKTRSPHEQVDGDRSPREQGQVQTRSLHEQGVPVVKGGVHTMNGAELRPVHPVNTLEEPENRPENPGKKNSKPRERDLETPSFGRDRQEGTDQRLLPAMTTLHVQPGSNKWKWRCDRCGEWIAEDSSGKYTTHMVSPTPCPYIAEDRRAPDKWDHPPADFQVAV